MSPRRELQDQIDELFSKSLDDQLSTAEFAQLDALIVSSDEALGCLLELSTFMADLVFIMRDQTSENHRKKYPIQNKRESLQ